MTGNIHTLPAYATGRVGSASPDAVQDEEELDKDAEKEQEASHEGSENWVD